MALNTAALTESAQHAVDYPDATDMSDWAAGMFSSSDTERPDEHTAAFDVAASNGDAPPCGTTLCWAGWLAFLNAPEGSKIVNDRGGYRTDDDRWVYPQPARVQFPDGTSRDIEDYACEVAGVEIGSPLAHVLFYETDPGDVLPIAQFLTDNPDADEDAVRDIMPSKTRSSWDEDYL